MGDIVAIELRGAWLGNRGILHEGTDVVRFHRGDLWITCRLQYRDWRLPQWAPGHFTVLFFHDEAVALAAGHRPCALCRRDAYDAYRRARVASLGGSLPLARQMDRRLHGERIVRGAHRRRLHPSRWSDLPDGAFVLVDGGPAVVFRDAVVPWTMRGYAGARRRPARGQVELITPLSTVAVLAAGYSPQIDAMALVCPVLHRMRRGHGRHERHGAYSTGCPHGASPCPERRAPYPQGVCERNIISHRPPSRQRSSSKAPSPASGRVGPADSA